MSIGFYIAIGIVVLSIIGFVIVGFALKKRISALLDEINSVQLDANNTIERFNNDVNAIDSKVKHIQQRTEAMMQDVNTKQEYIQEFSAVTTEFSDSLNELKASGQDLKNRFVTSPGKTTKTTFPSIVTAGKTIQKMFKKRKNKQKMNTQY